MKRHASSKAEMASCPVCGDAAEITASPHRGGYRLCRRCRLVCDERPTPVQNILNHYETCDPVEAVSRSRRDLYLNFLSEAVKRSGTPGKLLDVGCSRGDFLALAVQRGWEGYGVEPAGGLAGLAKEKGLRVATGVLAQLPAQWGRFDLITYWDVFTHVDHPLLEMERALDRLSEGGWIYMRLRQHGVVKMFDLLWKIFGRPLRLPDPTVYHPLNYSPQTMKTLAGKLELKVDIQNARLTKGDPYSIFRSKVPIVIVKTIATGAASLAAIVSRGRWVWSPSMDVWLRRISDSVH